MNCVWQLSIKRIYDDDDDDDDDDDAQSDRDLNSQRLDRKSDE